MTLHRSLLVASMGIGLLATGCLAQSDEVKAIDGMALEAQDLGDPGNGGGQNGQTAEDFHRNAGTLWSATSLSLLVAANTYVADLQAAEADDDSTVLAYAMRCAMASSITINGTTYDGGNLLSTTSGWTTSGLSLAQKEDLMTCMIAHLNPSGEEVPIMVSGEAITDSLSAAQASVYDVDEALWVARQNATGGLEFLVWPLEELVLQCPNAHSILQTRVCGAKNPEEGLLADCYVDVHDDLGECTEDANGAWTCLGHRALKTSLSTLNLLTLHPGCGPEDPTGR